MNGVIGMADMLGGTGLTAEQTQYVDTIRNSAEALVKIINDILDMSKLDAKKMTLTLAPFDLRACLQEVAALLSTQAHKKRLTITLDGLDSLPGQVVGDEGRLRQVLINLIGNAVKFTDVGGVSVRVCNMPVSEGCRIEIEVEDTGVGIAEDQLNAIFDSFVQADTATTRRFGGTGLGLSISRKLIDAMAGKMEVRSTAGAGSCFRFAVTLGRAAEQEHADPSKPDSGDLNRLQGRRILLAEDNRVNRMLIEKYLADTPVELRFAHDGQEAVDETCNWHPDLILMDMSMPVMNGLQATEYIRAQSGPQPVIVALTANAFDRDRAACLAAGMEGFLTKPVRRSDLLASLMHHCSPPQGADTG